MLLRCNERFDHKGLQPPGKIFLKQVLTSVRNPLLEIEYLGPKYFFLFFFSSKDIFICLNYHCYKSKWNKEENPAKDIFEELTFSVW